MSKSDNEQDYLEDLFLECKVEDIPIPKTPEIGPYENEVLEVMKSGCNRQIAEYVILEYKKQEDEDKNNDKKNDKNFVCLSDLYKEYSDIIEESIKKAQSDLKNNKGDSKNFDEKMDKDLEGFENEIETVMSCVEEEDNNNQGKDTRENKAKYFLHKYLFENKKDEEIDKIKALNKKYYDKRDAVIESALRKVKKIVNDDDEFKKFYKGYYGKDYKEDL